MRRIIRLIVSLGGIMTRCLVMARRFMRSLRGRMRSMGLIRVRALLLGYDRMGMLGLLLQLVMMGRSRFRGGLMVYFRDHEMVGIVCRHIKIGRRDLETVRRVSSSMRLLNDVPGNHEDACNDHLEARGILNSSVSIDI